LRSLVLPPSGQHRGSADGSKVGNGGRQKRNRRIEKKEKYASIAKIINALANNFELDDLLDWGFDKQELDLDLWAGEPPEDVEPVIQV